MAERYDLVIIGAGSTGIGLFERAARAGLKTLLLERDLPGRATTAVTSGLFHGGLRYLTYDGFTSLLMGAEAGRLSREYARIVSRDTFLWPVYRGDRVGMELVETLLEHYDRFAELRRAKRHVRLSSEDVLEIEPGLEPKNLLGALAFDEWSVDVSALVRAVVESGRSAGGEVRTGQRVCGFVKDASGLAAARAMDRRGRTTEHAGRVFVNAGGPWADEVADMAGCSSVRLVLRKGVHLVIEGQAARHAMIFPYRKGRYIGLYPRPGGAWIGPTDDPYDGPAEDVAATREEGESLEAALRRVLPEANARIVRLAAGVRPIFRQSGLTSFLSRDYRIHDHAPEGLSNFVTVTGGKLTTFRPMADETLRVVNAKLGKDPGPDTRLDSIKETPFPLGLLKLRRKAAVMPVSAALLGLTMVQHVFRRLLGRGREGLELYREVYRR